MIFGQPLSVSYGMGRDSTAMLIGLKRLGIRPDQVIFSDVGDEKDATYRYMEEVAKPWLRSVGFPELTVVHYATYAKHGRYATVSENCLANDTLPSLAFGGTCKHSNKFKHQIMDKFRLNEWGPGVEAKERGIPIVVAIGFDDSPADVRRACRMAKSDKQDPRFTFWYPLQEWGWDRERLTREIEREGLPVPPKSSCVGCPAMKEEEVKWTALREPHNLETWLRVEENYLANLQRTGDEVLSKSGKPTSVMGLWRAGRKGGRRGRDGKVGKYRPASWLTFVREQGLKNGATLAVMDASGDYDSYPDVPTRDCYCKRILEEGQEDRAAS
jgi:hypothetical protein